MKPKITFNTSGNSYDLKNPLRPNTAVSIPPAINTITSTSNVATRPVSTFNTGNTLNYGVTGTNLPATSIGVANVSRPAASPIYATSAQKTFTQPITTTNVVRTAAQPAPILAAPVLQTQTVQQVQPYTTIQKQVKTVQVSQVQPIKTSQVTQVQVPGQVNKVSTGGYEQKQVLQQYDRPAYQRKYHNERDLVRKEAATTEETAPPATCCGPACWALLALLGLAGLILGLLFGLGVIGGLRKTGDVSATTDTTINNGTTINTNTSVYTNNSVTIDTTTITTTGNTTNSTSNSTSGGSTTGGSTSGGTTVIGGGGITSNTTTSSNTAFQTPITFDTTYQNPTGTVSTQTNSTQIQPSSNTSSTSTSTSTSTTSSTSTSSSSSSSSNIGVSTGIAPIQTNPTVVQNSTIMVEPIQNNPIIVSQSNVSHHLTSAHRRRHII